MTESYKIQQQQPQIDYIDGNNDFLCVDQMATPRHTLFENDYEYQNVLMDIFQINVLINGTFLMITKT